MAVLGLAKLLAVLNLFSIGLVSTEPRNCRIVCDPSQSAYDVGVNGLVIPLSLSEKGSPGPAGPPGKAGPPGLPGPKGERSLAQGPVAFYAATEEGFGNDDVLKFTNVITNLGERYDSSTGTFTCRSAGVYHFSFYIVKTGVSLRADLVVNNHKVIFFYY